MWLWILIALISSQAGFSAPIEVSNLMSITAVTDKFEFLNTGDSKCDIECIRFATNWQQPNRQSQQYNFGLTSDRYWLKSELRNSGSEAITIYLVSEDVHTDELDLYVFDGEHLLLQKHSGDHRFYQSRDYPYSGFPFRLTLPKESSLKIYLMARSTAPLILNVKIAPRLSLEEQAKTENQIALFYLGAMLAIIAYNFLLFLSSKEHIYLLYISFQMVSVLVMLITPGYH